MKAVDVIEPAGQAVAAEGAGNKIWSLVLAASQVDSELLADFSQRLSRRQIGLSQLHTLCEKGFWAVELILSTESSNSWGGLQSLAEDLRSLCGGVSLLPLQQRRSPKRLLAMDMDSTLIEQEGIDELAREVGAYPQVAELTRRAMRGEMDFDTSLRRRCRCLSGAPASIFEGVRRRLTLTPGARRLVEAARRHGCRTALLSGGFEELGDFLARRLAFDDFFANRLEVSQGCLTGKLRGPIVNARRKAKIIRRLAAQQGLSGHQIVVLGDGANDLPMLSEAGLGIAFNAKPAVQARAGHVLNLGRLDAALCLMGLACP